VPSNKTCTIDPGVKIGGNVVVNSGATLIDNGAQITGSVQATSAKGIGLAGSSLGPGTVGVDVQITGLSGNGPGSVTKNSSYICDTNIGHDLEITGDTSAAGPMIVGDTDEDCTRGGNQIGVDLEVSSNKDRIDISDNKKGTPPSSIVGIGHNLQVTGNTVTSTSPVVESNFIAGNAQCQTGTKEDSDHTGNIVGGTNQGCPTS
jgi:hypothetical protein